MQFDLTLPQDKVYFSQYSDDFIEINGRRLAKPIKVNFNTVCCLEGVAFEEISAQTFADILVDTERPEVLLIGCGATQKFLHPEITAGLLEQGIGVEVMITAAALRTFNVLKADGRRVWAWLW